MMPTSLYLHVPFCAHICSYCAFNTYANIDDLQEPTVQAMAAELHAIGQSRPNLPVHTVFFGGGTPSVLTPHQFRHILQTISSSFVMAEDAEITVEANPNDLDLEYCAALRGLGVNRLSIGVQSANAYELQLFDRQHDYPAAIHALENARAAGFDNISVDLIYGTPGQTIQDWEHSLQSILTRRPEHISLYALELKGGTRLTRDVHAGRIALPDDDLAADMYDLATELFAAAGLQQYEISNWCLPSYESRHNRQYWLNDDYLGVGPGAHGYANGLRYTVVRLPQRYIARMNAAASSYMYPRSPATARAVRVDRETEIQETIMMGLRLVQEGILRERFERRFGVDLVVLKAQVIERYTDLGLLEVLNDRVRFTREGRFLSNRVIADLI